MTRLDTITCALSHLLVEAKSLASFSYWRCMASDTEARTRLKAYSKSLCLTATAKSGRCAKSANTASLSLYSSAFSVSMSLLPSATRFCRTYSCCACKHQHVHEHNAKCPREIIIPFMQDVQ